MAKKNNKRKRKKRPLNANPQRQAHAQLKGYLYQIWHSVNAWLDLADDEILYLECAEDFDIVSGEDATLTQVKHTQRNITLKSQEVCEAINNFWELQTNNSDRNVKFRFLTRSKIGKEQGNPFGTGKPGLELWSRCSSNEAAIKKISEFLQTEGKISPDVCDFLKKAELKEIYEQLLEPITWETDSKSISYVEQSIDNRLILHGNRQPIPVPPSDAKKVVDHLLKEALIVATKEKTRVLTKVRFLEIFEEQTTQRIPTQHLQHLQSQASMMQRIGMPLFEGSSDITIQSHPHIQTEIPPPYRDVFRRTDLLTNIQAKLQSEGIVVIHGGVDKGKTTLAKLTTYDIAGDWFWLNFTNKDPSLTDQHLQQLAIAVSNESEQVNVVLDDLNLQPQQLQTYEEVLGIVVYRVLERGAKLLITSQRKPPNNFIRSLGVSKAIAVDTPNFTESEIKQFAAEMECPPDDAQTWTVLIQTHTGGHPRLVHAWFIRLREEGWNEQNIIKGILQPPDEVVEEREAARQLLTDYSKDQREFLYRLSLLTEFRKDYAINIGEIPTPILHPGDVFSQLVGPWIDQVNETYYTISPLLKDAAKEVWSDDKIKDLHGHIADAIIKTKELTPTEGWSVFTHSMVGQNKEGIIAFIYSLMDAPESDWKDLCQQFSLLAHIKTDPPEELFPGDTFLNQLFRLLQYRIAVEVEPELVPKILEIWDKETKPYEPRQSYLLSRLMLATEILKYNQVTLPAKKLVGYLKEIIDIKNMDKKVWKSYFNPMEELKEINIDESNFFSFLFSFIYMRPAINVTFLNDLIDALDELDSKTRTLLLADFEGDNIEARLLIDGAWWAEANLENPNWTRCLQVFDRAIEKTIEWGYPHIAAASARGKAIIHDEYLNTSDTAHEVLKDITSKVGSLPVIEEERALVYFHQEHYREALNIYERILPKWDPPSEQLNIGPLEEYRRAAICAANLNDWKKSAIFLEDGANKTREIENSERYVGLYADAGFAYFKTGRISDCIKLLHRALQNFEKLPENNTDIKYFALKKRLEHTIKWIWQIWCVGESGTSNLFEPYVGFCSDPTTNEEILTLLDCPIGYSWLYLSRIEYRFGHETTVFQHALQTTDKSTYPELNLFLSLLKTQYDFRNNTLNELPARIQEVANACDSIQKHLQSGHGIGEGGIGFIPVENVPNFTSVENITVMLVAAFVIQLSAGADTHTILSIWHANSSELFIKEKMTTALNLIDRMLSADQNNALKVMQTQDIKLEERLTAALKVIHNIETSPKDLFHAHILISTYLVDSLIWLNPFLTGLAELLSVQWLEKIKFREALKMPMVTVPEIEKVCKSSETGKKKIGQILLAVHPAVSVRVAPEILQQFRTWTESDKKQKHATRKNPAAQRLIKAMEKPPHLTDEDIEALNQSIKEGKIPIKFDSPFELDEYENNE
ncbi:hypothetical protein C6501_10605 [Candidatus Poribacteria bacterium]|nr:MAG: hypothetical protein C6501_10605 [Candidatus Poribacteria bacterium]